MPDDRTSAPPRRWFEQPWLWFWVLTGSVAAALSVSYVVNTDPDDIAPVGDTAAFCANVTTYRQVNAATGLSADTPAAQFQALQDTFARVRETAPAEIRSTVDELDASLTRIVVRLKELGVNRDDPTALEQGQKLLVTEQTATARATERFSRYLRRACGIDLDAPVAPGSTTSIGPAPPPTVAPPASVPAPPGTAVIVSR